MRKLAIFSFSFAAATLASYYVLPADKLVLFCGFFAFLALGLLFFKFKAKAYILLLSFGLALGFARFALQNETLLKPVSFLRGNTAAVQATVTDYKRQSGKATRTDVTIPSYAGAKITVRIYDYGGLMPDLLPGDIISCELKFGTQNSDSLSLSDRYSSQNVGISAKLISKPELCGKSGLAFLYFPKAIARGVSEMVDIIYKPETAALVKALLIGDAEDLNNSSDLSYSLSVSGLRHIAAVSGLHVSFIYVFLLLLFGKRRAGIVAVPLVIVFSLMSGFSASVIRASVMLILIIIASFLGREPDGITTLSFPLLLMLFINPYSVGSLSLQLSYAAMAGVILFSPRIYDYLCSRFEIKNGSAWLKRFLHGYVFAGVSGSLGASFFTVPLVAVYFGHISLLSIFSNLAAIWAVSLTFVGGYLSVIFGALFLPLGKAMGILVSLFADFIILCSKFFANLPYSALYTANIAAVYWLIFFYAVIIIAYLLRRKIKSALNLGAFAVFLSLVLLLAFIRYEEQNTKSVNVLNVGQGLCVVASSPSHAVIVDCGGVGFMKNAGDIASAFLLGHGKKAADMLVLTHLHADHANGVIRLLSLVSVNTLVLSADTDDSDGLLAEIISACEKYGTHIYYIGENNASANAGDIAVKMYSPADFGDNNERGIVVRLSMGEYDTLITGDIGMAAERRLLSRASLDGTEMLVVGHHGSRYSSSDELLSALGFKLAAISVGNNSYGHPTDEVLHRLKSFGAEILRTDLHGNIMVRIKN